MNVGIVAGEASGDILGAGLLQALQKTPDGVNSFGLGGPLMIAAGCASLFPIDRLSVMGFVEPLKRLPELLRMRQALYQAFITQRPDVVVGIDSPDFNLGLELKLRTAGIPVVHYVSPSVWAWRQKRVHKIKKAVDLMLTLFPFEADFYHQHQVPVCFVGHPLADQIPLYPDRMGACKKLNLDPDQTYIAILPGSRENELKYLAAIFIETAKRCWQENNKLRFLSSLLTEKQAQAFSTMAQIIAPGLPLNVFTGCSHDVLAAADCVLVTSGTATLETMLYKRPMVIAYRMAATTYHIARHLVTIPYIGIPNILANEALVPEFIQSAVQPGALAQALLRFVNDPGLAQQLTLKFHAMHADLRRNANQTAAQAVLTLLK